MKRLRKCFIALISSIINFQAYSAHIYLAPNGSDKNDGSKEKPLATLATKILEGPLPKTTNLVWRVCIALIIVMISLYTSLMDFKLAI